MIEEQAPAPTIAEVLGRTARELRGDHKLELVAYAAKSAGLNWGTGRIADLEAGRVSPTVPTLFALAGAFGVLLGRPLKLAELFAGDGPVRLVPDATAELAEVRAALSGHPVNPGLARVSAATGLGASHLISEQAAASFREHGVEPPDFITAGVREHPFAQMVKQGMLEADYRVARSLGLDDDEAAVAMGSLWGRSFTAQRDLEASRRYGPEANPQQRGRVSRELKAQLQEAINRGDD
jgi:transcriptional regulator with XRE-family HTH domain